MKQLGLIIVLLFPFMYSYSIASIDLTGKEYISRTPTTNILLKRTDSSSASFQYSNVSPNKGLQLIDTSSLKKMAFEHASFGEVELSIAYLEKYLRQEFETSIFLNEGLQNIQDTVPFQELRQKYEPRFSIWSFIYLYVALIGFYIAVIINFNKKIDATARLLIGAFIFIHSFFILHISLNITNYQYEFPHSYLMSTVFSFLYGPLLYFYFKRITQKYGLKKRDLLHLLPTALFLIYIIPIYSLTAAEKLDLMLERTSIGMNPGDSRHLTLLVLLKLASLIVYGYFIRKVYLSSKKSKELSTENYNWQKNIYTIHILYIAAYSVYGVLISSQQLSSGFAYHTPIVFMAFMVLYVGYSANVQPNVFSGLYSFDNRLFFKYEKSGLTESLSKELRENLLRLFNEEKIYKESDISLESLASRLNTTRHNASQVINEHFKVSFHELINKYRIQEAQKILNSDYQKNFNIIDIAYEVGYNNKVTFNKAFKKVTHLTPSEFQKF
ncbi:MAG: helix-turn-helix domain-containing protein, partial [Aurantibacter sp.]